MENTQTAAPEEVHQLENTESAPVENGSTLALEATSDGWDDAKDAFDDPEDIQEPIVDEPKPEQQTEGDPKSHLEQGEPDYLKLDDLKVPQKYKGAVRERIQKLASELEGKVQASEQQLGETQQATQALVGVFKDIAQDPSKLVDYIAQYGEQFGLDHSLIQQYGNLKNSVKNRPQQGQVPNAQAQQPASVDAIFNKYAEKLLTQSDPKDFLTTLNQQNAEVVNAVKQEMVETVKQLLGGYHEKVVGPNLKTLDDAKAHAEHQSKVGMWNDAASTLKTKYQDFDKYEKPIKEKLKTDPLFRSYKDALNANPQAFHAQGITHETLMENVYQLVTRADHIAAAKTPRPKFAGVEPSPKFTPTTKTGGDDWDDIKAEIWS